MGNELITLNKTLPIHNGTVGSTDSNSLINYFVSIAILAEMAVSKADDFPWLIEENLSKRRNSYELDKHLQNMLSSFIMLNLESFKLSESINKKRTAQRMMIPLNKHENRLKIMETMMLKLHGPNLRNLTNWLKLLKKKALSQIR